MHRLHVALVACALGGAALSGQANAAAVFTFVEQGGDVVGTLSGSLDLTGLSTLGGYTNGASINPLLGDVLSTPAVGGPTNGYDVTGPAAFGTGGGNAATSRSGNLLHLNMVSGYLFFDASYVSGSAVSGGMVFGGTDLAGLGVTPGSYVYTMRNQETFTLVFREGSTTVPAPASLPLLAGALGMLGLAGALRRKDG